MPPIKKKPAKKIPSAAKKAPTKKPAKKPTRAIIEEPSILNVADTLKELWAGWCIWWGSHPRVKQGVIACMKLGFLLSIWLSIVAVLVVFYYSRDLPDTENLKEPVVSPAIKVLAVDGQLIASLGGHKGDYMNYNEVTPHLWQSILATEDRRFFYHFGVDIIGLVRAMYHNMRAGYVVQGGSTVTQQLAKITFLSSDRTMKRKIQEMLLALWFELNHSKEEILTMYINRVYLGAGNYGVDAAARNYFGKTAKTLSLYESAIIAGLLKAPTKFSPFTDPEMAAQRAYQVILNMEDAGYLEKLDRVKAKAEVEQAAQHALYYESVDNGKYFGDWIASQVPEIIVKDGKNQTLTVSTTLNLSLQAEAEKTLLKQVTEEGAKKNVSQGAVVTMSPDGAIRAMVGGIDYRKSQYNRATQALRQPGSSFKLFVYLAGLEHGFSPNSVFVDTPITVAGWTPHNHDGKKFMGEMYMREAFAKSLNTIAVQISEASGRKNVVEMAHRLGITTPMSAFPSIALGSTEVSLLELTQAYAHVANKGKAVKAYAIEEIRNLQGKLLYKHEPVEAGQLIDTDVVNNMLQMMVDVTTYGTGRGANFGRQVAGKTGTSQEYKDAWFVGFTPQFVTGVWVGNDNNTSMKKITGGTIPARVFSQYMSVAHEGLPPLNLIELQTVTPKAAPVSPEENTVTSLPQKAVNKTGSDATPNEKKGFWKNIFSFGN